MNYYIHDGEIYSHDELQHYGVIGMRWGIRRGKYSKAFKKASKKANRIKNAQRRAERDEQKANEKLMRRSTYRSTKKLTKAMRQQASARNEVMRLEKKGRKWERKMAKEFANVKLSHMDDKALFYGRDYIHMLVQDTKYDTKAWTE